MTLSNISNRYSRKSEKMNHQERERAEYFLTNILPWGGGAILVIVLIIMINHYRNYLQEKQGAKPVQTELRQDLLAQPAINLTGETGHNRANLEEAKWLK